MVNSSAAFSFLHLNKCYLYHFSEEAFTEHSSFKDIPLSYSIQSLVFYLQEFEEKNKTHNKKLPYCHCDLAHSRQSCM